MRKSVIGSFFIFGCKEWLGSGIMVSIEYRYGDLHYGWKRIGIINRKFSQ